MSWAYYNEIDPFAAEQLRQLIGAGHIANGEVDERSIEDVKPSDLTGFTQCHFFAGVGVWSYALRRAAPDGLTIDKSGQEVALANLSARQAKALGLLTSGTYGQHSTTSSASANLSQSLASKLRVKTDLLGSTLYSLTWKVRATPQGRLIPALRASVRRTSDNDCIGCPTPQARDDKNGWDDCAGMVTLSTRKRQKRSSSAA